MKNKNLIKQLIYRSEHRGFKEMDILLGNFVKKYIYSLDETELEDLRKLLLVEDDKIYEWYFQKSSDLPIKDCKILLLLRNFKL
jgi:antitoxin CptB